MSRRERRMINSNSSNNLKTSRERLQRVLRRRKKSLLMTRTEGLPQRRGEKKVRNSRSPLRRARADRKKGLRGRKRRRRTCR